ncbi:MAG TPA: hypothetical protein VHD87_15490 [Acidimicrobiales bacterium]|nr:hypothetical protein [Acidimicrobiales bacterium]
MLPAAGAVSWDGPRIGRYEVVDEGASGFSIVDDQRTVLYSGTTQDHARLKAECLAKSDAGTLTAADIDRLNAHVRDVSER